MRSIGGFIADAVTLRHDTAGLSESPIESAMLVGLLADTTYTAVDLDLSGRGIEDGTYRVLVASGGGFSAVIVPQLKVNTGSKRYRLDIGIVVEANGRRVYVALECDGHAFHSAPDDVRRDKERDRDLAALGWITLRFHGGEIVKGRWSLAPSVWRCLVAIASAWTKDDNDLRAKIAGVPRA